MREATVPLSISAMEACLWPTRCTPVALGFKGSEWGSKLGCKDSEMQFWVRKFGDAASESSILWDVTGPFDM